MNCRRNPSCCEDRPCCALIWDDIRAAHTGIRVTLLNTTAIPDPSEDYIFVEKVDLGGGLTFYQCGIGNIFGVDEPSPPAIDPITISSGGEYRKKFGTGINSGTGLCNYVQSRGGVELTVTQCDPAEVRLKALCQYGVAYDGTPPDWVGSYGFTCVAGTPCTRWEKTVGDVITVIEKDWSPGGGCAAVPFLISANYLKLISTIPGGIPLTLDVTPAYNPAGLITRVEWI